LIFDLLGEYGGQDSELTPSPTRKEINDTLTKKIVPELVKARDGYQLDSPSDHETDTQDYEGLNGDDIKALDQNIAYLARHYNIPMGYEPPSSSMSPSEREGWQRNQEQIARETKIGSGKGSAKLNCPSETAEQIADAEDRLATFCPSHPGDSGAAIEASKSCTQDYQKILAELRKQCK
jgi:hypothetical protein